MNQQLKILKINLDEVKNPHKDIEAAYKNANALHMWIDKDLKPEYINEQRIFNATSALKKGIKHKITALYRKVVGKKEYVFFFKHLDIKHE